MRSNPSLKLRKTRGFAMRNKSHVNTTNQEILELFSDRYTVNKEGEIFSNYYKNRSCFKKRETPLLMKSHAMSKGYKRVYLCGRGYTVHRIVAVMFIGLPKDNTHIVGHLNDIPDDNRIENLKWMSIKENAKYADINGRLVHGEKSGMSKLNNDLIKFIFKCKSEKMDNRSIAKAIGVNESTIGYVVNGKTWTREAKKAISEIGGEI